jgi:hypothetical protein
VRSKIKATKKEILDFIKRREIITPHDLIEWFGYTYSYACKRLSLLKKQGLVHDLGDTPSTYRGQWCLTDKGYERLYFLERREGEEEKVVRTEELAKLQKQVKKLGKERVELEELVKALTSPGGLKGEIWRLLREYEALVRAYARAPQLGVRPDQLHWSELTLRLEKLLKYSQLLPADERQRLLDRLAGRK